MGKWCNIYIRMAMISAMMVCAPVSSGILQASSLPESSGEELNVDTIHIPEVLIIHSVPVQGSPMISSKMDSIPIQLMAGQSLSELLAFQPAVHIKSAGRGSLSTASFRGTDASHTKVYWNGIRLNSPMLGQVDFSLLPVAVIDDLSILYGGSSLTEGSGALGGSVLIESAVDWRDAGSISFSQEIGSFGTYGSQGRLAAGNQKIRSDTRLYRSRSRNDYPFLNTDIIPVEKQQLENAAYSREGMMQEVYFRPGDRHEISLKLWYQEAERELPPLMSQEGNSRDEWQGDRNLRTSMEYKTYPGFGTITVRSGYAGSDVHYYLHHNDLDYRQFDSRSRENSLFNTVQGDFRIGRKSRYRLRADFNRHRAGISDLVRNESFDHSRNEASFLASIYRELADDIIVYFLLRQERADGSWLPTMPSAGFRWDLPGADRSGSTRQSLFRLSGNLSRNYNLPSLNDLYWIPGGNPGLRPENSLNADLSLRFNYAADPLAFTGSVNVFAARVKDWILWKPTRYRYWEAENIAEVFSRGMDMQIGSGLELGDLSVDLKAGHTYTRSTNEGDASGNDGSAGQQLIYIPVHASMAYLNLSREGYFLNWTLRYTGRRYTQPGGNESLNPYTLNDLHAGKNWKIGSAIAGLRFSVYNLFNVSYQAIRSRPVPMRNYALTISLGM